MHLFLFILLFNFNDTNPKDTLIIVDRFNRNRVSFINFSLSSKTSYTSDGRGLFIYDSLYFLKTDTVKVEALGYKTEYFLGNCIPDTIKLSPLSISLPKAFSDSMYAGEIVLDMLKTLKTMYGKPPYTLQGKHFEEFFLNHSRAFLFRNSFSIYCYPDYFKTQPDPFKFHYRNSEKIIDETTFSNFKTSTFYRMQEVLPINSIYQLMVLDVFQTFYHRGTYCSPFPKMESFMSYFKAEIERGFNYKMDTIIVIKFVNRNDAFAEILKKIFTQVNNDKDLNNPQVTDLFKSTTSLYFYYSITSKKLLGYDDIYYSQSNVNKHIKTCAIRYDMETNYAYPLKISSWELLRDIPRFNPYSNSLFEHYNEVQINSIEKDIKENTLKKVISTSNRERFW